MSKKLNINNQFVYFTRFSPKLAGGGCRRLVQLLEATSGIEWKLMSSMDDTDPHSIVDHLKMLLGGVQQKYRYWDKKHHPFIKRLWNWSKDQSKRIYFADKCKVALVDDPIYFAPIVHRLKKNGTSVIGVCHNIESLSRVQVAPGRQLQLLKKEIGLLAECDLVLTISREETFLLQNFGIASYFLPYFPPIEVHDRLMNVRDRRISSEKKDVLMIGTANNLATRQGMVSVIKNWQDRRLGTPGRELLVAGFGTESLGEYSGDGVRFLGPLSDQKLDELLPTISASLCYQESASGALTRIPEMLVANIPVLANPLAARTYYNLEGVVEFRDFKDLDTTLAILANREIEIPLPVAPDGQALQERIIRISEGR